MRSRVIGGEFELKGIPEARTVGGNYYAYASGRAALYQILRSIELTTFKVWLPDWLCESMIDAVRKSGLDYDFYRLGCDLRMDVERFVEENRPVSENNVIVLVNYFGLVDVEQTIAELRAMKVHSVIVEDDVQALFSFMKDGYSADFRFTSLRKTIASPDGGLVKTRREMPKVKDDNTFTMYKLKGSVVKGCANETTDDGEYLSLFERGEELIEENYESVMSDEAATIFAETDLDAVGVKRKENAAYLVKELQGMGIEPLLPIGKECVPLFVPIVIDKRDEVRRALRRNGIFCPVHWPLREDMMLLQMGRQMAEKELSLVIDQRYELEDMKCIVEVLQDTQCKQK